MKQKIALDISSSDGKSRPRHVPVGVEKMAKLLVMHAFTAYGYER